MLHINHAVEMSLSIMPKTPRLPRCPRKVFSKEAHAVAFPVHLNNEYFAVTIVSTCARRGELYCLQAPWRKRLQMGERAGDRCVAWRRVPIDFMLPASIRGYS